MKRLIALLFILFFAVPVMATDYDDTDQLYGWDTATGQFWQTWADHKTQLGTVFPNVTIASGIGGLTLSTQELSLHATLEAFVDNSALSPTLSNINPTFGSVTASSFISSAADGAHFLDVINTTSITATATAGRAAYYNGRMYLADGTDWDGYFLEDTDIDEVRKVDTHSYATSQTLTAAQCYGDVIYVAGAATITLPAVADGMSVTVITVGAVAVSVDPNAADKIWLDGTALDDGDKATNLSTTGDIIVLTYYSADGWYATSGSTAANYVWTDGGV